MRNRISALRNRHRDTLRQIFTRPVPTDLKWQRIEALIVALGGEVREAQGARVRFLLNGSLARFHRPHPSPDADKGVIVAVKEWLEDTGVEP